MIRAIALSRRPLWSLSQTLTSSLCSNPLQPPPPPPHSSTPQPLSSSPTRILTSRFSHSSKQKEEEANSVVSLFNRDPNTHPKLFVVQPRLRPDTLLQPKLNEALCLANSLEDQRDGCFHSDFFDKALPSHIVVQNPAAKVHKVRAGPYLTLILVPLEVKFSHRTIDFNLWLSLFSFVSSKFWLSLNKSTCFGNCVLGLNGFYVRVSLRLMGCVSLLNFL